MLTGRDDAHESRESIIDVESCRNRLKEFQRLGKRTKDHGLFCKCEDCVEFMDVGIAIGETPDEIIKQAIECQ